jgi:hypothetical protein
MAGVSSIGVPSVAEMNNYIRESSLPFFQNLYFNDQAFNLVDVVDGITGKEPLTNWRVTDILQPSKRDGTVNPIGDVNPNYRFLDPNPAKVDLTIIYESYMKDYESRLRKPGAFGNVNEPPTFMNYVINEVVLKKLMENMHKAQWMGVRSVATSTVLDSFNGFKKRITDAVTAVEIPAGNVISGAAITAANAYDMILAFVDSIDEKQKEVENVIYCAPAIARNFVRDRNTTFGVGMADQNMLEAKLFDYNTTVVGVPALIGQSEFYLTTKGNFITGVDSVNDASSWSIYEKERSQLLKIDVACDSNFAVAEQVYVRRTV